MLCSPQARPAKLLWLGIVCLGFMGAGILISKSYKEWQDNPVATTITTHVIDDLEFPMVAVCPPKDSNTALYHDLAKLGNMSLSDKHREVLSKAVHKIFKASHSEYVKSTLATPSSGDMDLVYQGFQSLPKPLNNGKSFQVKIWNTNGTISTPFYGKEFVEEYYKEDRDISAVLDIPINIKDQVGSGSLILDLEIYTRKEESWEEQLELYTVPPDGYKASDLNYAYKFHWSQMNWAMAEDACQSEGGHLASVATVDVEKELLKIFGYDSWYWLGGRSMLGEYSWSDNSTWGFHNFYEIGQENSKKNACVIHEDGMWWDYDCENKANFVCQIEYRSVRKNKTVNLELKKEELNPFNIHVRHNYTAANQQMLDTWEKKNMTGFRLTWRIQNPTASKAVAPRYQSSLLIKAVQLAKQFRIQNMTREEVLDTLVLAKMPSIRDLERMGGNGQATDKYLDKVITSLLTSEQSKEPLTNIDKTTGFEVFHAIKYCPFQMFKLHRFVHGLLSNETPRTMVQSLVSIFHTGVLSQNTKSFTLAKELYLVVADMFKLQYGNVLIATGSTTQLQTVIDYDWPFFTNYTESVRTCLKESICDELQDIFEKLG